MDRWVAKHCRACGLPFIETSLHIPDLHLCQRSRNVCVPVENKIIEHKKKEGGGEVPCRIHILIDKDAEFPPLKIAVSTTACPSSMPMILRLHLQNVSHASISMAALPQSHVWSGHRVAEMVAWTEIFQGARRE